MGIDQALRSTAAARRSVPPSQAESDPAGQQDACVAPARDALVEVLETEAYTKNWAR
jgi:hypothetical protein